MKTKLLATATALLMQSIAYAQTEVTVLMVYTDDARAAVGGVSNIETDIIAAIDDGNLALTNSNVNMELTIAGMREVNVNEGRYSSMGPLLRDLSNPNNSTFGVVHEWRDELQADLVYLIFEGIQQNGQANAICGAGIPCNQAFEDEAFSVGQRGLMDVAPIVIHELGHVMGLRHDRTRDCGSATRNCGQFLYPYSFGYIDPQGSTDWGTIMAGGRPFPLIDYFSTPDEIYPETGQVVGEEDRSDAARHLNNVRDIIASFRSGTTPPPPPPPPPGDDDCDGAINFLNNTSDDYSNSAPGSAEVSEDGCSITLTGNEWRITNSEYQVTSDTVITFEFSTGGVEGEIQGVGFDSDNGASSNRIFQLTGTQDWGIDDYSYTGGTQTFTIPVGQFYTGNNMGFVIANDKDSGSTTNTVTVSNVRISN
ncbi:M12 family metallo-peptidase [Marinibactrum halimedae]|nr:M12 family metallo-peptidase [Marinibactrum halimedae]MCD9459040.1 M12 family metallo-peptidase [Marinibactrum halimedae]